MQNIKEVDYLLSLIGFTGKQAGYWINSYNDHLKDIPKNLIESGRSEEVVDYLQYLINS